MSLKDFSASLDALAKYALAMTSTNPSKIDIFLSGLRSDITKDVMMGDHTFRSHLEALSSA